MKLSNLCFAVQDLQVLTMQAMVTKKLLKATHKDVYLDGKHLRIGRFTRLDVEGKDYECDIHTGQLYQGGVCMTSERLTNA
jgi:hypothetical protein